MTITALVPTYRRPRDLARCLEALKCQVRTPDEVMVVMRDEDAETRDLLTHLDPGSLVLRTVTVEKSGMVAALNPGLDAAEGNVISITDDDAAPRPDWLAPRGTLPIRSSSRGRWWARLGAPRRTCGRRGAGSRGQGAMVRPYDLKSSAGRWRTAGGRLAQGRQFELQKRGSPGPSLR